MDNKDKRISARRGIPRRDFLRWAAVMGAGAASTMLIGCGSKPEAPSDPSKPSKPATPSTPAEPTFPHSQMTILQGVDAESMDPHVTTSGASKGMVWSMYDKLGERNEMMQLIPWLAASWSVVNDETWEIKLRDDVTFHNGEKFTSEIARENMMRFVDPETKNVYASLLARVKQIETPDDFTLRVHTEGPFAILMEVLSMYCEMMPMELISGAKDPGSTVIGTGAYKFVEWVPGERMVCEAADGHFTPQPKLERVLWRPVAESSTRVVELKTGNADLISNVSSVQVPEIEDMVQPVPLIGSQIIVLNCEHPAMSDARVRQAMNYAVDKESIIRTLLHGFAEPLRGPCGVGMPGYDPALSPYEYDPDKARQLLRDAGWGDGFDMVLVSPDGRYPNDKMVSEAIAGQWSEVGINTSVRVMEWGTFVEGVLGRDFDGYFFRQGSPLADAAVRINFHSQATNGRGPWHGYVNSEVDTLIDDAPKTMDAGERESMYKRMNEIVRNEAPWVLLYQYQDIFGVSPKVKNFVPRPDGIITFGEMYREA